MQKVKVLIGWDLNYGACSDAAPGCIATAQTLDDMKTGFASALEFHLEGMRKDGDEIPAVFEGKYELEFEMTGRALVQYAGSLVSRSAMAKASGIPLRQLGHYFTGEKSPRPQQVERIKNGIKTIVAQLSVLSL